MQMTATATAPAERARISADLSARRQRRRRNVTGWLFIAPIACGVLAFQFVPILVSMGASFTRWNGITEPEFVGLSNFIQMFTQDPLFLTTLKNTVYFTVA